MQMPCNNDSEGPDGGGESIRSLSVPYYSNATKVPEAGVASGNNVARKRDEQVARMQRCPKRLWLVIGCRWSAVGH
jgi:hypothetical protein